MKLALPVLVAALASMPLFAQTCAGPTELIGAKVANAVTPDGNVVVGYKYNPTPPGGQASFVHAVRWTQAGGMEDIGATWTVPSSATDVSADGTVLVGTTDPIFLVTNKAFRWTAAGGRQDLTPFFSRSSAHGVSADGSVVVGKFETGGSIRAFRWAGTLQNLGVLPGLSGSYAYAVSADGSVVVGGSSTTAPTRRAFRWTAAGGMQDIGAGTARAVSDDGTVVVGEVLWDAFRWTAATGRQTIQAPAGFELIVRGVSADGEVVVGTASAILSNSAWAFRWTAAGGMQAVPFGSGDSFALDVSADGSVVVGAIYVLGNGPFAARVQSSVLGETYCRPTVANSTGCGGVVLAEGDPRLATGSLELTATLLPPSSFGFFVTSRTQGLAVNAGGGQGTLCLGGSIGRFVGPGQVMSSGAQGSFTLAVDLNALPTPTGLVAAQPGETWHFQAWHRDANPTPTSNLTDAVSVTFQ